MAVPENGDNPRARGEVNQISFDDSVTRGLVHAVLNSSLYYLFFCAYTDTRHINPSDVTDFPIDVGRFYPDTKSKLNGLSAQLENCFIANTRKVRKSGLLIDSINTKPCKSIIDKIDAVLADHYGFLEEELDYIINYDIKYRMGQGNSDA